VTWTLVTGGSGFIGRHLVAALVARGHRVRILDLHPPAGAEAGVHYVQGSILDAPIVREAFADVDYAYHLAALPGMWMPDKNDFHAVNCHGTQIVLAAARECGVARFLHCSTESILFGTASANAVVTEGGRTTLEDMPGTYTRSKLRAEQLALKAAASGFPVVIANPTMPIGSHNRHFTPPMAMLRYFLDCRIQLFPDFVLNLVDVRDVAAGLLLTMERGRIGERYILGGENIALKKLLAIVATISGRATLRIPIPALIAQTTAAMMEFVANCMTKRPPTATLEGVRIALRSKPLCCEKSRHELGYAPRPIASALQEAVASILTNPQ
jgi:dihydroflavonol-4-reductase